MEAEYIAEGACCAQLLWIMQQLRDLEIHLKNVSIRCDSRNAIKYITKNPVQHSQTKHVDVRHHFIRDHVEKGNVSLEFVSTNSQLADIFTQCLSEEQFNYIHQELGMIIIDAKIEGEPSLSTNYVHELLQAQIIHDFFTAAKFKALKHSSRP